MESLVDVFRFVKAADGAAFRGFSSGVKSIRPELAQTWRDRARYLEIDVCHAPRRGLTHYILERAARRGVTMSWRAATELAECCGHDVALAVVAACGSENARTFVELACPLHVAFSAREISVAEHWFFAALRGEEPEYCTVHGQPLLERLFGEHLVGSLAHDALNEIVRYGNSTMDHGWSVTDRIALACAIRGVQASVLAIERAAINIAAGYGAELSALVVNNPVAETSRN
jgi:hypothetical protein